MFDIFDQHWTILILAAIAFRVFDAIFSEESSWLRWYPLLGCIVIFYGFELLVSAGMIVVSSSTVQFFNLVMTVIILILFLLPLLRPNTNILPRRWVWLIPFSLAVTAFGADRLVQTDLEQIENVIKDGIKAAETESTEGIEAVIASDYEDSYHHNKERLMRHCSKLFSQPLVEDIIKKGLNIDINKSKATAVLNVLVIIDKDSPVYKEYFKPAAMVMLKLELKKKDGNWLISKTELIEIDRRKVNWNVVP